MKHEMSACLRESAGPVLANTQYQSACTTPDIQHLVPLSTQSSPSCTALVRMPTTSLPACGSESPKPARISPVATPRTYCCFCSSLPAISTGPVGSRVSSSISAAVFEYLATSSIATVRPRIPAPEPPYSSGITRPSRPVSRKSSKRSWGYVGGRCRSRGPGARPSPGRACGRWPGARRAPAGGRTTSNGEPTGRRVNLSGQKGLESEECVRTRPLG